MKQRATMAIGGFIVTAFAGFFSAQSVASLQENCSVPRIANEFSTIKQQRLKCEENDELPFCEAAEDYELALTPAEASGAWDCLMQKEVTARFSKASFPSNTAYKDWARYSTSPYTSAHANRFVDDTAEQAIYVINFANTKAQLYGKYENSGPMPAGAILAKYSMVLSGEGGTVDLAPAYMMTKVGAGKSPKTKGWVYDMIAPAGVKAPGKEIDLNFTQADCASCHMEYGTKTDSMLFMPQEVRVSSN